MFWSKILIIRGVSLIFGPRLRLTLGRTNGPRGGQGGQIGPGEDTCDPCQLFMISCHEEDHRRDAGDTLFRSRKYAWIVKGRVLAKTVLGVTKKPRKL